jgi:hypothetical protein
MKRDRRAQGWLAARSPSLSFCSPTGRAWGSLRAGGGGGEGEGGNWNGEWILCPERDIWRPLRPGKNNINIGKERRESFAGWLPWLAGWLVLLRAGDIKYNHNNKRPRARGAIAGSATLFSASPPPCFATLVARARW